MENESFKNGYKFHEKKNEIVFLKDNNSPYGLLNPAATLPSTVALMTCTSSAVFSFPAENVQPKTQSRL